MISKKRKFIALLLVLTMCFVMLPACSSGGAEGGADGGEVYNMDFMIYYGTNQSPGPTWTDFCEKINERSEGRLNITCRPTGELPYTGAEALKVVSNNNVQIADANTGYISGDSTIAQLFTLPFLITTGEEFRTAYEIIEPIMTEDLAKFGSEVVLIYNWPKQCFWGTGNTPQTWADFNGLKVRTYAAEQQQFLASIGAAGMSLTFDEVPGAAQRGVINGMITSATSVADNKMFDYLDWGFLATYSVACNFIIMNSEQLAALPEDLRGIFLDACDEYADIVQEAMLTVDEENRQINKDGGMDLYEPDEAVMTEASELSVPIWEEWAKTTGYEEVLAEVREALGK